MPLMRFFIQVLIGFLLLNGLISPINALPVEYASPMGDEHWRMTGNRLRCGLSLTIPNYGIAYFEQYAASPPHFILNKWQQVDRQLPATIYARDPIWKPKNITFFITKAVMSPGEYALFLSRDPTLKALVYLSQGYQTQIRYESEQGFFVTVSISPIRFQKAYAKYQRCIGGLLPFNYNSVRVTVLLYGNDESKLTDGDKQLLNRVVEYVRADFQVKKVVVSGYSDNTGRKSYNNAISEDRAKAVEKYLLSKGLDKELVSTTWYGVNNPVASNETEEGMAKNRRVVIEIEK